MSTQRRLADSPPAPAAGGDPPPRWLPCVRHRSDRWWLPLSRQSADVLAAALLRDPDDPRRIIALQERLRLDPPLLLFAALATAIGDDSSPQEISIAKLAQMLSAELPALLTSGDAALGTPDASEFADQAQESLFVRWAELHRRFLHLPHTQWLNAAADWLELTGPAVPAAWRRTWPRITDDVANSATSQSATTCYAPSELDLTALARSLARGRALEDRFQDTLGEAKRAALKQFAYGLSHEINNPLANISTRAQALLRDELDIDRRKSLQRIIDQTMRAHEMVADLMFYAHPPAPQKRTVSLHKIIRSVIQSTEDHSLKGRGIELAMSPSWQEVTILADRYMLVEAIRALVRNAIEAIGCDGRVELGCYGGFIGDEMSPAELSPTVPPVGGAPAGPLGSGGPLAVVVVRDSGPGLSEAARVHAFDPYFSGREAGRGLGVGLCRVERIAKLHGGGVSLQSGPAGCVARLWIPQAT